MLPGALCKCVIWHWHVIDCDSTCGDFRVHQQYYAMSRSWDSHSSFRHLGTCLCTSHWHSIYLAIDLHVRDSSIFWMIYCTSLQRLNSTLSIFIFLTQSDFAIERGAWKTKWHLEVSQAFDRLNWFKLLMCWVWVNFLELRRPWRQAHSLRDDSPPVGPVGGA